MKRRRLSFAVQWDATRYVGFLGIGLTWKSTVSSIAAGFTLGCITFSAVWIRGLFWPRQEASRG
jgi:hypothetical protein